MKFIRTTISTKIPTTNPINEKRAAVFNCGEEWNKPTQAAMTNSHKKRKGSPASASQPVNSESKKATILRRQFCWNSSISIPHAQPKKSVHFGNLRKKSTSRTPHKPPKLMINGLRSDDNQIIAANGYESKKMAVNQTTSHIHPGMWLKTEERQTRTPK